MLILQNIVTLAIIPKEYLTKSIFPRGLRRLGQATREFKRYMDEALDKEEEMISKRETSTGNLVSALIRASEGAKQSNGDGLSNQGLRYMGIYSCITTRGMKQPPILWLLPSLFLQPTLNGRRVAEELEYVLGDSRAASNRAYEKIFPNLKRCLALG